MKPGRERRSVRTTRFNKSDEYEEKNKRNGDTMEFEDLDGVGAKDGEVKQRAKAHVLGLRLGLLFALMTQIRVLNRGATHKGRAEE